MTITKLNLNLMATDFPRAYKRKDTRSVQRPRSGWRDNCGTKTKEWWRDNTVGQRPRCGWRDNIVGQRPRCGWRDNCGTTMNNMVKDSKGQRQLKDNGGRLLPCSRRTQLGTDE